MIRTLLFVILSLFMTLSAQAQNEPRFIDTFKPIERTHDFGTIYEKDGKVVNVFRLRNEGKKPVVISAVNTWCGCMVADYTKRAVRPGETAQVAVSLDPDHKQGNFVKQVVVLVNDGSAYVRLWVKANIVPMVHPVREDHPFDYGHGLFMNQQMLPFPELTMGQTHTFELKLANDTDKPMTIQFKRVPNNTVLKMPSMVRLKPHERKPIRVSSLYSPPPPATRRIHVIPVVNGKEAKPLVVKWNVAQKFRLLN
mgnify:CR=1 FL=1